MKFAIFYEHQLPRPWQLLNDTHQPGAGPTGTETKIRQRPRQLVWAGSLQRRKVCEVLLTDAPGVVLQNGGFVVEVITQVAGGHICGCRDLSQAGVGITFFADAGVQRPGDNAPSVGALFGCSRHWSDRRQSLNCTIYNLILLNTNSQSHSLQSCHYPQPGSLGLNCIISTPVTSNTTPIGTR